LGELLRQQLADFESTSPDAAIVALAKREGYDHKQLVAWTTMGRVLLNLDEFITRE
jgi:hypothetical protein